MGGLVKKERTEGLDEFQFRDLHPNVFMGTASDRYAGWIGQIYSEERYTGRTTRRAKKVGGKSLKEEVLPVESVEEYFRHFSVLELDFTFYRALLDKDSRPTQNHHVLQAYRSDAEEEQLFIPFKDATSGQETYGAGRYLDLNAARNRTTDGKWILDLNGAYNPWCVYSEDYTCPFVPQENWLAVPVRAGEKSYSKK